LRCTIASELILLDRQNNTKTAFWYPNARNNLVTPTNVTTTEKRSQETKSYLKKPELTNSSKTYRPSSGSTKSSRIHPRNKNDKQSGQKSRISAYDKPEKDTHSDSTIYLFRVKISFNVPPDQSVNSREKFATLLSVISAHFPGTALER